ncbi:MAG: hypothetical protein CVV42_04855 [Candidatus Riflebacteria bacterium HGW-Riflebacteria-2]|jgi:hypothetical protein|nr:MAG: hypothetical protein CVV42_04855 [Candidatus Riflebacteria bacterium HGW-Riflebacteria-2]
MNFRCRAEIGQYLTFPVSTKVSQRFQTSFDAATPDLLLHFTAIEAALNPLSILLPEGLINDVQPGWPVSLQPDCLCIGRHRLPAGPEICQVASCAAVDSKMLAANLARIRRSLSLFGRQSVVTQTIENLERPDAPLAEAVKLLNAGTTDLCLFSAFLGVGEGLTPSFDDFLAGMLFIDRFYSYNRFVGFERFLEIAAARTTRQALQQYLFAGNGHFSRQFEQFAGDLAQRQIDNSELLRLLAWGHSSGTDILCGIWHYFSRQVRIDG